MKYNKGYFIITESSANLANYISEIPKFKYY